MTFSEAKRLSLLKWEFLKKFDYKSNSYGALIKTFPELEKLAHYCGFCERHKKDSDCKKCPIDKAGEGCYIHNSIFSLWALFNTPELKRKYASDMYNLILSLEEK